MGFEGGCRSFGSLAAIVRERVVLYGFFKQKIYASQVFETNLIVKRLTMLTTRYHSSLLRIVLNSIGIDDRALKLLSCACISVLIIDVYLT
jgi:hypothetical protein